MPIVLGFVVFLLIWLRFGSSKASREAKKEQEVFWNNESLSNSTRKVDISKLDYITIPIERLPFTETTDQPLVSLQKTITTLSKKPILNLTGLSNTDLKLKYGVSNITLLSDCDNNYTLLVNSLYKWGSLLYGLDRIADSITVLEFGIQCNTDVSRNYTLLATIYKDTNAIEKIDNLIQVAENLHTLMKDSILSTLKEIKLSSYLV